MVSVATVVAVHVQLDAFVDDGNNVEACLIVAVSVVDESAALDIAIMATAFMQRLTAPITHNHTSAACIHRAPQQCIRRACRAVTHDPHSLCSSLAGTAAVAAAPRATACAASATSSRNDSDDAVVVAELPNAAYGQVRCV